MEPGAPWRDPRQGYATYGGLGSAMQMQLQQRADAAAGGGVLKRSLGELERWQAQQQQHVAAQQALYLRAVRQRTAAAADIAALLRGGPTPTQQQPLVLPGSSFGGGLASPSSTLSSLTTASRAAVPLMHPHPQTQRQVPLMTSSPQTQAFGLSRAPPPPQPAASSELFILQELEKQLLDDDDDEPVAAMSGTGSAVTNSEWEETIQQLNSITAAPSPPGLPAAAATPNNNNNGNAGMTRSPSNSTSSTASSSASCSPPTPGAASRQLLSEAAIAIADGNHEAAATHLAALKRAANQHGDAEQRLIAMMVAALSSRIVPTASALAQHLDELCGAEQRAGSQLLHDISPCFRLALHAASVAIVEAVGDHRAIHLVDFDVSFQQHAALIQYLADRRVPGTSLKVTAVTDPTSPFTQSPTATTLPAIAEQLKKLADRAGIEYRFKVVSCRAAELDASRLGCAPGEALAVNLAFALSHVPDESVSPANPRDELLRRVRALGPQVVVLVEQELNTNTAPLAARFTDACAHYGAILESLDATLGRDSAEKKARAEAALAKKAANAVGREGPDRLERCEVFGKWRARFGMAGFHPRALSPGIADQVSARVGPAPPGFTVKADNGVLRLCWMGRVVTVASAWH
ncbi:Scarecrow-like protein 8 [Dichanthelium oligosanthes]|uniref:Scarecrow-like protein 8 n=1 Tax=Dichanthelium oligosanthes TaxID=888268 RepID=A0A1E5UMX3_9POAL|nr:Scarecrow-like protein 8 [Dichanthelium oligosanthes]